MYKILESIIRLTEPNEKKIYTASWILSLLHLALMWDAHATDRMAPAYSYMAIHLAFVGALYVIPKEHDRHAGNGHARRPQNRAGHLLVVLWVASAVAMLVIEHFQWIADAEMPSGMAETTVGLIAFFGATLLSKKRHDTKNGCPPTPSENEKPTL